MSVNKKNFNIFIILPFVIILQLCFVLRVDAQAISLEHDRDNYNLGRSLYILQDKEGGITIDSILRKDHDDKFVKSDQDVPNYGFTSSTYWVRFEIENPSGESREMYLKIANPLLKFVELYTIGRDNQYRQRTEGNLFPFTGRELKYRNFIFKIRIHEGMNRFYLKIRSSSSLSFPVTLHTVEDFAEHSLNEYIILGVYYGILIVMILYNLFIFYSVRDINYLYYIIYITSNLFTMMTLNGISFQYIWPENTWWADVSVPFFVFLNALTVTLFSCSFLDMKKYAPVLNRFLQLVMIVSSCGLVLSFFLKYSTGIRFATGTCVIGTPVIFLGSIFSLVQGYRPARFYLVAWASLLLGIITLALESTGYLPSNFITKYGFQVSSAAEVILLSLALGDRINILKDEKDAAQQRTIEIQKNATEELEIKVMERTMELNRANEDLKELDKLKSNFFANISHEIRTPLTLILSPVESVLQGDYGHDVDNRFFENVQRNAIKLLKLINNLLDFSKIEAGQMNLKIREIDIVVFVRNYINAIHSAAESKGISLSFVALSNAIRLHIDIEKMDKIVMNLFSNALKFTDKGGFIRILIKEDDRNCYIVFEDSGIGIPRDKYETIFDRFSQVDTGSTRKYEGTGIGLALVREFVYMHGGTITVESRLMDDYPDNHGTTFTIAIPRGREHLQEKDNLQIVECTEIEESISDYRFTGMREMSDLKPGKESMQVVEDINHEYGADILVVEDNPDMQNFLKMILQKYYNVHIAGNGDEGIKTASILRPALIVSDVMMPVMNGYEMTRRIKEDKLLGRTPVILLTAKSEISSKIEGIEYGADDYLTKPFNSKELLTRIRMLLKTRNYEYEIEKRNNEIEEDLKIARLIQHRLLPQNIPDISGYKFSSTYIPMDKVGGDFYDFRENGNSIEIFIADVSGHGLVSAFISMIAKMAYDSIYIKTSCAHVLYQMNDILCNSTVNSIYMTTFFCLIDRDSRMLKYANAGHFYPLLYREKTGEIYELEARGKPLGWFDDLHLVEKQIQLEEGDRIVFYTDGITECMDADRQLFGDVRFKDFIRENSHMEPSMFSARLIEELKAYSGDDKFNDDLCLLVLDVC